MPEEETTERGEDGDEWDLAPPPGQPAPEVYGQCRLPLTPSPDPDVNRQSGMRFGTKRESFLEYQKNNRMLQRFTRKSELSLEFRATDPTGVIFYVADESHEDFIALFLKDGQLIYGWNCGSGAAFIETEDTYNDGDWHLVQFSRTGNRGTLHVDRVPVGDQVSMGETKSLEVTNRFYLGGIRPELYESSAVQRNLKVKEKVEGQILRPRQFKSTLFFIDGSFGLRWLHKELPQRQTIDG